MDKVNSHRLINPLLMVCIPSYLLMYFSKALEYLVINISLSYSALVYTLGFPSGTPLYWTVNGVHTGDGCCCSHTSFFFPQEKNFTVGSFT